MEKQPYAKHLSENAIGLLKQSTKTFDKNGIFEKCIITGFNVDLCDDGKPQNATIQIRYNKYYFDKNGKKLDVKTLEKKINVKDLPELGMVEMNGEGQPNMETFETTTPENLEATRWGVLLGPHVYPGLIYKVNEIEGYEQEQVEK